jgi:hypothetical protein
MSGWPILEKKIGIHDLTNIINSAHPVSFIMKRLWLGLNVLVFDHFQEMLSMMILK